MNTTKHIIGNENPIVKENLKKTQNPIREHRNRLKLKQGELALLAGIYAPRLNSLEQGLARPTVRELSVLSNLFGITANDLEKLNIKFLEAKCEELFASIERVTK